MQMREELLILFSQDLLNSLADCKRLSWMDLEPALHPLHYERHDHLEYKEVVVGNFLQKREHNLRKVLDIEEDWAPVSDG